MYDSKFCDNLLVDSVATQILCCLLSDVGYKSFNMHDVSGVGSTPAFKWLVIVLTDLFLLLLFHFDITGDGWARTLEYYSRPLIASN
jgi:hypothetical protein